MAGLILLLCAPSLLLLWCFFEEISMQQRRRFRNLKKKIKDLIGIDREVLLQVESYGLAGSDEWNRMKKGAADQADIRATMQLNFVVALMYVLPVTVVGLQLVLMQTPDLTQISKSFLVASIAFFLGDITASSLLKCYRPASMIVFGLIIGLISSLLLLDYGINTTAKKQVMPEKIAMKLMVGLTMTTLGFTLSKVGLDNQLLSLLPRSQYLYNQGKVMFSRSFGAVTGAVWASLMLLATESTTASFIPFMIIAICFLIILFTCLRERLQPHASFAIKRQERLLKDHLLD